MIFIDIVGTYYLVVFGGITNDMLSTILRGFLSFLVLSIPLSSQDVDSLPCDPKDNQPVILGVTSRDLILKHRKIFSAQESSIKLSEEVVHKFLKINKDVQVVIVFGSWCSDTQRHLPWILALDRVKNPYVKFTYLGVGRTKDVAIQNWPSMVPYQITTKVPSVWIFKKTLESTWNLKGSIIEQPSDPKKNMTEELLEILSAD